jgi:AmmeMemoRadiSam system protein A
MAALRDIVPGRAPGAHRADYTGTVTYTHALQDDEKRELLRIARATLREHGFSGRIPPGKPHREALTLPAAVFVSLHRGKALRGCIGAVEATQPIYRAIQEMAIAAATRDPRFGPVEPDELEHLVIEISVLGDARPVTGPEQVVIGSDGLRVEVGDRRGLLLPQVAVDAGWDAATFLGRTCTKAGLAEEAWQAPDATVLAFGAQVFSDTTHPAPKKR